MWLNFNYMVARGLQKQNESAAAQALMTATVDVVSKYYELYGVIFEFYDADDKHDPRSLLRKKSHSGGIRDYHWSAALTFRMLLELNGAGATAT